MFQIISDTDSGVHLRFGGSIEAEHAVALRTVMEDAINLPGPVVLDFTSVTLIDGSGIGAIAFLFKRLRGQGRALSIIGASGQPLALLDQLGIAGLLGVSRRAPAGPLSARGAWARSWLMSLGRLSVG
jgi:anti-anti-sigma factor